MTAPFAGERALGELTIRWREWDDMPREEFPAGIVTVTVIFGVRSLKARCGHPQKISQALRVEVGLMEALQRGRHPVMLLWEVAAMARAYAAKHDCCACAPTPAA